MSSSTPVLSPWYILPRISKRSTTIVKALISARELEILHLIAYEYSSKEIAHKLYISQETVNSHRKNIMAKLDVKNTAGMVRVAMENKLIQNSPNQHVNQPK